MNRIHTLSVARSMKSLEVQGILSKLQHTWIAKPEDLRPQMDTLLAAIFSFLPEEQRAYFVAAAEKMDVINKDYDEPYWLVSFDSKSATELHLVQLGLQPELEAQYLQVRFILQRNHPSWTPGHVNFVKEHELVVLAGPVKL